MPWSPDDRHRLIDSGADDTVTLREAMIDITVASDRVAEFCGNHGLEPPEIHVVDVAVIGEDGKAVFGRCFESGLILIDRGLFQILYEGSLADARVAMRSALLSVVAQKASYVLLHELYHWKQISKGEHNVLSREEIERDTQQFSDANESQWRDLMIVTEPEKS